MFGTFNIVVTCNSRLRLRLDGDAGAWRRRLLIVRFEQPPPPRAIPDFDRLLLREEGAGILRWALAGFVQLQEEFADIGDFALTEPQRKRIDSLLAESESLRVFLMERVSPHDYGDVTTAELMQAYAEFCGDRGWNPLPVTLFERQVGDLMMEIFHRPKSHDLERNGKKSNRGWHGVRLLAANAEEDA
jgi:phage/plasmid-associated DNA primase